VAAARFLERFLDRNERGRAPFAGADFSEHQMTFLVLRAGFLTPPKQNFNHPAKRV
jgi:hypothetical protein